MELDEFKKHWNAAQKEEIKQQEHSTETINTMIMNTTNALGELKKKSIFWRKIGGWNSALLILLVITYIGRLFLKSEGSLDWVAKLPLIAILIMFILFSKWTYNRQEEIFSNNTNASLKESLRKTLLDFKSYYRFTNLIFLIISPLAFYAVFKLSLTGSELSLTTIMLSSIALTGISMLSRYWYYKTVFFRRIKDMESNLSELENVQGF